MLYFGFRLKAAVTVVASNKIAEEVITYNFHVVQYGNIIIYLKLQYFLPYDVLCK